MRRTIVRHLAGSIAIASLAACASAPAAEALRPRARPRVSMEVISAEELRAHPGSSLYDIVRNLRPRFMSPRGARPTVFVDGRTFGPVTSLAQIPPEQVRQIRLLSDHEATLRYGAIHSGAVLDVELRRSGP
jgi:hypothetical protein